MSSLTITSGTDTTEHSPATFDVAAYLRRAERVIPQGASAGGRPLSRDVITSARGAYLTSGSGKRYIDHLLSYGPIVLGHADPYVNDAVKRTIDRVDLNWVGPQTGEVELCERIVRLLPSAEKVVLLNTGTDALQHALHVARAATGRHRILKFHGHYHGWAGELGTGANFDVEPGRAPAPDAPNSGGAAPEAARAVLVVDWNDGAAVRAAFDEVGSEIAAVFTEPYLHSYTNAAPAPGFLEMLREVTVRYGAVLVFDEVRPASATTWAAIRPSRRSPRISPRWARRWATAGPSRRWPGRLT